MRMSKCINQGCIYFGKECLRHKCEGADVNFKYICESKDFAMKILDKNYVRELEEAVKQDEDDSTEEVN